MKALPSEHLARAYLAAKRDVIDQGYVDEVAWQLRAGAEPMNESLFVREAAWVVLSAGMRESVVRQVFPALDQACGRFDPHWLTQHRSQARADSLAVFRHERKIDAILDIADTAASLGTDGLCAALADPQAFLTSLPYVGPVTWRHLAKNLGAPVAKPDRHLLRFARAAGWQSVDEMCEEISSWLGDPVPVVDVVLWRWSVLHRRQCTSECAGVPHERPEQGATVAAAAGSRRSA